MTRPNLFVVGAPKAGTTSLYDYLAAHPDVMVSPIKELHFFSAKMLRDNAGGPGDRYALRNIVDDRERYASAFSGSAAEIVADVSPSYLYYSSVAPQIREFNNEARILILVRDPVERAFSQYLHMFRAQREMLDFRDALLQESSRILARWSDMWRYRESSLLASKVRDYIRVFGKSNVLILQSEGLSRDPATELAKVSAWIGMESFDIQGDVQRNGGGLARSRRLAHFMNEPSRIKSTIRTLIPRRTRERVALRLTELNTSSIKPTLPPDVRGALQQAFRKERDELQMLMDEDLKWSWL